MSVKWLHISDVHSHVSEQYHRKAMYEQIVAAARARADSIDLVFFTGDLAYSGAEAEYELLEKHLLVPLRAALSPSCRFFAVPGNHDVARKRVTPPRLWMENQAEAAIFQEVGAAGQQKRRDVLLPRFSAYSAIEFRLFNWGEAWLEGERGSVCKLEEINGHRLAIVGINTAWLCHDNDDWGKLTAGKAMVEAALREASAAEADAIIVLGHHPLSAMEGEKPWSDGGRIKDRLAKANALYLHGHLHKAGTQQTGDSMQSVLAIQAPSGFQGGDSQIWRNGILWGGVDWAARSVLLEPQCWDDDQEAYVPDSVAIPQRFRTAGTDLFVFPLPGDAPSHTTVPRASDPDPKPPRVPEGWEIIDRDQLARLTATRPSPAMMGDWFDGRFPSWEVAVADGVRPRRVVDEVARRLVAAHASAPQPTVTLLTGAGGEGKSAALLQVAASLLRSEQSWTCVSRKAVAASLPEGMLIGLPFRPGHAWIVVVDDAENIGQRLADALRALQPRTDVHLLLAARAADWAIRGLNDVIWQGAADFRRFVIAGLDADDARRIADGWAAYGDEAKGVSLRGKNAEEIAAALLEQARQLAARQDQGALLGALLMARSGEDLKARVGRFIAPLENAPGVAGYSLRDIYGMIVAMHAENQLYLSRSVLAYALNCDEATLDQRAMRPLRDEAMLDSGGTYILTRHRRIAEAARDWLAENSDGVDHWYPFLAKAALRQFLRHRPAMHDIYNWSNGLAGHFTQSSANRWPVAVAVARSLFEANPTDPMRLTSYSSTLRRTGNAGLASGIMRTTAPTFLQRRDVLFEWSVAAGEAGDPGLSVWIAAKSIADHTGPELSALRFKLGLAGLGAGLRALRLATNLPVFASGQAACGRLGLMLDDVDAMTKAYFEEHANAVQPPPTTGPNVHGDISLMHKAVTEAADHVEVEHNPQAIEELVGEPDTYHFKVLSDMLSSQQKARGGKRSAVQGGLFRPR